MSAMTDHLENKLADFLFRAQALTPPATYYVALYTTATNDAAGGTEVTGGSYARVAITASLTNFTGTHGTTSGVSSGTGGQIANAVTITFPTPSAGWGTVTHAKLMDASSGGNPWAHGALGSSRLISTGDSVAFAVGALVFTFA